MNHPHDLFPLNGKVQYYSWGGYHFLPELLGLSNPEHRPFAEYWMGAHPAAPSEIREASRSWNLDEFIARDPEQRLGDSVWKHFGQLPYLFKILDVRDMLSIQVHPGKAAAEAGYERENAAGIPLNSPRRNFKDANHKPEVMVALSDFWLLHGFLPEQELEAVLDNIPEFRILKPAFLHGGYEELYRTVMEMEQLQVDEMLHSLAESAVKVYRESRSGPRDPAYWAGRAILQDIHAQHLDRGIFSLYFFNILKASPGEAVFQGAGIPHAYLEGQNVELMANSDNVLRGGLTSKQVDVPELLRHTNFEGTRPRFLPPVPEDGLLHYPCPVEDFGLDRIRLAAGRTLELKAESAEILILTRGSATLEGSASLNRKRGDSLIAFHGANYRIRALESLEIFRAFVPTPGN